MKRCDIVIPTFNQAALTVKCFASIKKYSKDFRVIWIDNGSDGAEYITMRNYLNRHYAADEFTEIRLPGNLGFVKATNIGMAASTAPYTVLMNNDTEASDLWLERMANVLEKQPSAGLVGPLCTIAQSWQNMFSVSAMLRIKLPTNHYTKCPPDKALAFFCTMIRRSVIKKIGYLSEDFGIGFGDDDWYCEAARRAGFDLYLSLNVVIPHYHRTTFKSLFKPGEIQKMQTVALAMYNKKKSEVS